MADAVRDSQAAAEAGPKPRTLLERFEAFISRLSTRNSFWNKLLSMIWLPYAFRSGITMKQTDDSTFQAVLPFRRFNRNWYNAMAGAALLGNSEIAGGSYVFQRVGGDYTVVCKKLDYKFLRPCFGPAIYKIATNDDIDDFIATGKEFNITIKMNVVQALTAERIKPGPTEKEKRVGRVTAVFHVTPKDHLRERGRMRLMSNSERLKKPAERPEPSTAPGAGPGAGQAAGPSSSTPAPSEQVHA
ncbi:MAG: hypothetical protein AAF108_07730 [Planctomycetota bacterium]